MICMRNVRIFRIKRGRFLKFSKTKENCLASNKYIAKNSIIFSHLRFRILTFHRTSMRIKLKKKKKISKNVSSNLLEFTNESLLGLILKIKKKKRRGKKKKKLSFRCRVKNRRNPPDSKRLG